jgi:hypothetical protein
VDTTFLIKGLTPEQCQSLTDGGIQLDPWPGGFIFDGEEAAQKAVTILGVRVLRQNTEHNGLTELVLVTSNGPGPTASTAHRERSRANYSAARAKASEAALAEARAVFTGAQPWLDRAASSYRAAVGQACFPEPDWPDDKLRARFAEEYKRVGAKPKVLSCRPASGAVLVTTDTLCATNDDTGVRHEIGKFLFILPINLNGGPIRCFNSTRRVDAVDKQMNAPTVHADGTLASDEIEATLHELLGRCEIAALVDLLIQTIEGFTEDDELWKYIDRWPVAA